MPDHAIPDRRIPLHVSVKIRHGIVRAERERLGMTQRQFAELAGDGVSNSDVCAAESFRFAQMTPRAIQAIARACCCSADDLLAACPPDTLPINRAALYHVAESRLIGITAVETTRLLSPPPPENRTETTDRHRLIVEALKALPFREREVLAARFGLTGEHPCTLEECGQRFRIGRERVRCIEASALRRLRLLSTWRFGIGPVLRALRDDSAQARQVED